MMKAVCVEKPGGPENLLLRSIPRPEPKAGEVLIKVHATALNRADLLQVNGVHLCVCMQSLFPSHSKLNSK